MAKSVVMCGIYARIVEHILKTKEKFLFSELDNSFFLLRIVIDDETNRMLKARLLIRIHCLIVHLFKLSARLYTFFVVGREQ